MTLFVDLPSDIRTRILTRARGKRIVFPEAADARVQAAAEVLERDAGVSCILLSEKELHSLKQQTEKVISKRAQLRGKKMTAELLACVSDPFYAAGSMLEIGLADAAVGGAVATTAHVIRAALATIGADTQAPLVTSCFLFKLRQPTAGGEDVVLYADAGVVPQPDATQLVQIASLAARAFASWTGREPRLAFLSFSTNGSALHADVEKVREASTSFAAVHPQILSEGELQFDAAVVPEVALRKNPSSRLAGRANVFVFPDLDAGNICYKVTQRLAGAEAWGPILLGTAKPYSDLSRGASASDIAHAALLTLALSSS